MKKRILVLFRYCSNEKVLIENFKKLEEKYGFKILPLYMKNLRMSIPIGNNLLTSGVATDVMREYEDENIQKIEKELKKNGINERLRVEIGSIKEIIEEYLKKVDCMIVDCSNELDEIIIDVLKIIYKPIFIVKNSVVDYKKIAIVSDDGIKINKSVTNFLKIIPEEDNFDLLSWKYDKDENNLLEYLKFKEKNINCKFFNSDNITKEEFFNEVNKYDFIVMGNLSRSFLFEKITKKMGLDLITNIEGTIFIG